MITLNRGTTVVATRPALTDGSGRAQTDVAGLPDPGPAGYAATFVYAGSDFYLPSTATLPAVDPAVSVTGGGSVGADPKTRFALALRFKHLDRDERGDQPGRTDQPDAGRLVGSFAFDSKAADVHFESESFKSLNVSGGRAEILGVGRMEESTTVWQFRLVVVDGTPDTFELSIWDATGSLASPRFHIGPSAASRIQIR